MGKYRKKPVVIEAVQLIESQDQELENFLLRHEDFKFEIVGDHELDIHTLEGTMRASAGDWIIRGVKGEFYPCRADIFEATYEQVEDQ